MHDSFSVPFTVPQSRLVGSLNLPQTKKQKNNIQSTCQNNL